MTERPIIFSGPMVRAILDGLKTQTRRVVQPQPSWIESSGRWKWPLPKRAHFRGCCTEVVTASREWWEYAPPEALPYRPGDTLWVREAFYIDQMPWDTMRLPQQRPRDLDERDVYYRADGECCQQIPECCCREVGKPRWRPSIHMPRWAARLLLRVTAVRVQRVQDIGETDARAEGADAYDVSGLDAASVELLDAPELNPDTPCRNGFSLLWDSLNERRGYGWEANPWVWVIEFERVEAP